MEHFVSIFIYFLLFHYLFLQSGLPSRHGYVHGYKEERKDHIELLHNLLWKGLGSLVDKLGYEMCVATHLEVNNLLNLLT